MSATQRQQLQAWHAGSRQQVSVVGQQPAALGGLNAQYMQQQQLGIEPLQTLTLQCHQGLADAERS